MDLNMTPTSEEDEEEKEEKEVVEEKVEKAVDVLRREREERRMRMRRRREEEGPPPEPAIRNGSNSGRSIPAPRESIRTPGLNLPQGWLECPGMGDPIEFFIPSKVPLAERFDEVIPPGRRYSKNHVNHRLRAQRLQVALVIDLTNTTRYYSPQEWTREGTKHVKVPCKGRDEVPEPEAVNTFVWEVMKFRMSSNVSRNQNRVVLVHCTHGHNRTGYMIIHYLMRTQYWSVEECLKIFADARPPGIYKIDYIESLYKFYNERRPEPLMNPGTPEWKRRKEVDLNGDARGDDDEDGDDGGILAALQDDAVAGVVPTMTNDDVLGDAIPEDQERDMQFSICNALVPARQIPYNGRQPLKFPGSQPVSLDRRNLQLLRRRFYYATWKADGTRYMMLINRHGCYLIDRNFRFRRVQLRFPRRRQREHPFPPLTQHFTLLDGEMVVDTMMSEKNKIRRYLVYDMMILNEGVLNQLPFHQRWNLISSDIIEPRVVERKMGMEKAMGVRYMYEDEAFSVRRKDFWELSATVKVLNTMIPALSHEADGLILQGWDDLYVPHTHEGLLKWKYARMNSVDFLLQISPSEQYQLFLMERGKSKQLEGARVTFPDDVNPSTMAGKIIECSWNPVENQWEYMRIRHDKLTPNAWHVYEKVMTSLEDKITEEVLLKEIDQICRLPLYIDRQNAEKRKHDLELKRKQDFETKRKYEEQKRRHEEELKKRRLEGSAAHSR